MAQTLTLKVKGLITNPNTLDPTFVDGAMGVADNIVVDKDNLAESRRGFQKYNNYNVLGGYNGTYDTMFNFEDTLIIGYDDKLAYDDITVNDWTDYSGTFAAPEEGFRIRPAQQNQNLYITTSNGIKKLESINSEFEDAGMVRSLDGAGTVSGSTGWFTNLTAVCYRMVWLREDANKNLIVGAPSSRLVLGNNSGSDAEVVLSFTIPSNVTVDDNYQIYRSNLTENLTDEPSDELQLVLEGKPDAGEITAKEFTVVDDVADTLRGATLYTSPSQEGIANANESPPFAKDMGVYKNHIFYANTKTKQRLFSTMIGVSGGGFDIGDTFTVDGVTYTGALVEDVASDEFYVSDSVSPSLAIEDTVLSLVRVINQSASNTGIYAYYLSGFDEIPGKLMFERRNLEDGSFTAISSAGASFSPELPSSGANGDNTSDNEIKGNRIYISKFQQPESVPLLQYLDVGAANDPIKRIVPLRDSIFIFKDDGVYKLTGESVNNFRVSLFDNNIKLLAPESAVTFNNTVFCMTLQGVVSVSESGVAVVSRAIEEQLLKLIQYDNFNNTTFGVTYESERKYILFCVASNTQSYPTQAYVYNSFTNAWTRWVITATCGLVSSGDDKLFYGGKLDGFTSAWVHKERKSFTEDDYVDDDWGILIQAVNSSTEVEVNRVDDCVIGYWIRQIDAATGEKTLAQITDIDEDNRLLTLSPAKDTWSNDPVNSSTVYKPINCRVKYVANTAGNPGMVKHFREGTLFFRQDTAASLNIGFETNFRPDYEFVELDTIDTGLWGTFGWGSYPFGELDPTFNQPLRFGFPQNKRMALWTSISVEGANAFSSFSFSGASLQFEVMSERYQWNPGG